jgi:hypothetical protein
LGADPSVGTVTPTVEEPVADVSVPPDTPPPELEPPTETPAELPSEVDPPTEDDTPDVEPDTDAPAEVPSEPLTPTEDDTPEVEPDSETPAELPSGVVTPTDDDTSEPELPTDASTPAPPAPACTPTVEVEPPPVSEEPPAPPLPPLVPVPPGADAPPPDPEELRLGATDPDSRPGSELPAAGLAAPVGIDTLCDAFPVGLWDPFGFAIAAGIAWCALLPPPTRLAAPLTPLRPPTGLSSRPGVEGCRSPEPPGSSEAKACSTARGSGRPIPLSASSGIGSKATSNTSHRSRLPIIVEPRRSDATPGPAEESRNTVSLPCRKHHEVNRGPLGTDIPLTGEIDNRHPGIP